MTELRVSHLIDEADELLDSKCRVGSYCLFMNTDEIQDILSKIRAILPEEIKAAEMILKRRDAIFSEAQTKAERIINEANNTAANILSESELIRLVREKATKIQEQVKESCDEMKNKASMEADSIRKSAYEDAIRTKDGAQAYAEQVLNNLAHDVDQIHRIIKNGQDYLAQQKSPARQQARPFPKQPVKERPAVEQQQ